MGKKSRPKADSLVTRHKNFIPLNISKPSLGFYKEYLKFCIVHSTYGPYLDTAKHILGAINQFRKNDPLDQSDYISNPQEFWQEVARNVCTTIFYGSKRHASPKVNPNNVKQVLEFLLGQGISEEYLIQRIPIELRQIYLLKSLLDHKDFKSVKYLDDWLCEARSQVYAHFIPVPTIIEKIITGEEVTSNLIKQLVDMDFSHVEDDHQKIVVAKRDVIELIAFLFHEHANLRSMEALLSVAKDTDIVSSLNIKTYALRYFVSRVQKDDSWDDLIKEIHKDIKKISKKKGDESFFNEKVKIVLLESLNSIPLCYLTLNRIDEALDNVIVALKLFPLFDFSCVSSLLLEVMNLNSNKQEEVIEKLTQGFKVSSELKTELKEWFILGAQIPKSRSIETFNIYAAQKVKLEKDTRGEINLNIAFNQNLAINELYFFAINDSEKFLALLEAFDTNESIPEGIRPIIKVNALFRLFVYQDIFVKSEVFEKAVTILDRLEYVGASVTKLKMSDTLLQVADMFLENGMKEQHDYFFRKASLYLDSANKIFLHNQVLSKRDACEIIVSNKLVIVKAILHGSSYKKYISSLEAITSSIGMEYDFVRFKEDIDCFKEFISLPKVSFDSISEPLQTQDEHKLPLLQEVSKETVVEVPREIVASLKDVKVAAAPEYLEITQPIVPSEPMLQPEDPSDIIGRKLDDFYKKLKKAKSVSQKAEFFGESFVHKWKDSDDNIITSDQANELAPSYYWTNSREYQKELRKNHVLMDRFQVVAEKGIASGIKGKDGAIYCGKVGGKEVWKLKIAKADARAIGIGIPDQDALGAILVVLLDVVDHEEFGRLDFRHLVNSKFEFALGDAEDGIKAEEQDISMPAWSDDIDSMIGVAGGGFILEKVV